MSQEEAKAHPSSQISYAIDLYFQYCHRQPVWCFDREDVKDPSSLSEELICSILTLTARFSQDREDMQHHGDTARTLVMLRIANGTVELETIESLCLLSYSSFLGKIATSKVIKKNAAEDIRRKRSSWSISSWSSSSTMSLGDARSQLYIQH